MILRPFAIATSLLVFVGSVAAATPEEAFRPLDKDQDGRLALDEFYPTGPPPLHPRMRQVFESFDKERRGSLGFDEVAKVIQPCSRAGLWHAGQATRK